MRGFIVMADYITTEGLEARQKELERLVTDSPAIKRELQAIIRKAIAAARKRVVSDARGILQNDPRQAYRAVRYSVYKQIFGGQMNILSPRTRGAGTNYVRPRKLDQNPNQRGGNRTKRNPRTIQIDSYQGKDRGFILRFINAGTVDRQTRYGNRGYLRARDWFGRISAWHMNTAANDVVKMVEEMLNAEFKLQ